MTDTIQHLIEPHIQDLGGFQARRLLPSDVLALVGPFIFFDHLGPAVFPPGRGVDVRPHPHINLATVTYLFEGVLLHLDTPCAEATGILKPIIYVLKALTIRPY
ncbi:pirin family protein [Microcoleus sp. D2_18a_B4]|uniref:pirin family protein n=1 Tax=Microcoleus sp. D2_18a_B4 TaxID=3055329 RepID=UPI002FD497D5